jgi:hypothetical protein
MLTVYRAPSWGTLVLGFLSSVAFAAPGDIHRVAGAEVVNLRAGPTEASNIRGTGRAGRRTHRAYPGTATGSAWVLRTGEEGWIYGGLLPGAGAGTGGDAGFLRLSESFDRLMRRVNGDLGYPLVEEAAPVAEGVPQVRPTTAWLRSGGRDAHLMGALAFYELWKNHQNGRPVTLVMTDDRDQEYIRIADAELGPELTVAAP